VDPTANQDNDQPATDRETFQLEFDSKAEQWRVRSADNQYWSVESASGIQATGTAQYAYLFYPTYFSTNRKTYILLHIVICKRMKKKQTPPT